ncbi:MAG: arylformamidase [Oligoflexales bacterium]|nr:arylformamidase [Oligoflexales bacterium]
MIIDISPPLSFRTPVWPGDTPLKRKTLLSMQEGANLELSTLETTVHIGAHADAPSHYQLTGASIDQVELEAYIGPCQVIKVQTNKAISKNQVSPFLGKEIKRLLLRTDSFAHSGSFSQDFAHLTPELIDFLGNAGVRLVGIDTPSVDAFDSKELACHQALLRNRIYNLEGIDLSHVDEGYFELIALPLKLVGFDASPVRAILRK